MSVPRTKSFSEIMVKATYNSLDIHWNYKIDHQNWLSHKTWWCKCKTWTITNSRPFKGFHSILAKLNEYQLSLHIPWKWRKCSSSQILKYIFGTSCLRNLQSRRQQLAVWPWPSHPDPWGRWRQNCRHLWTSPSQCQTTVSWSVQQVSLRQRNTPVKYFKHRN